MFALLRLAISAPYVDFIDSPKQPDAAFDFKYFSSSGTPSSLTMNDAGHYLAIRTYNGDTAGSAHLKHHGQDLTVDGLSVAVSHEELTLKRQTRSGSWTNQKYFKINFTVTSNANSAKRFDIGVFADSAFAKKDNAKLEVRDDRRGVKITNPSDNQMRATYVLKGQYFPDVDTIYIGEDSTTAYKDHTNYPFFENDEKAKSADTDTVLAFSWKNKTIYPDQTLNFGFLFVQGDSVDLPPFVVDKTSPKEIEKGQEGTITVEVANYEEQTIQFKLFLDDAVEPAKQESYETKKEENFVHTFTHKVSLKNGAKIMKYKAYAIDPSGIKSNEIEGELVEAGAQAPTVTITNPQNEKYDPNVQIHVTGKISNEGPATLYYKFDNLGEKEWLHYDDLTSEGEVYDIRTTFPSSLVSGDHTITIWAISDSTHAKSQEKTLSFKINPPPGPTVYSAYASEFKVQPGRTIIIFGEANDPNSGQNIDIKVKFGDVREEEFLGQIVAGEPLDPFAFTYEIPDVNQGKYVVHITATDGTYTSTEANFTVQVVGADREVVEYANFTDTSARDLDHGYSKATFNVYYEHKKRTHSITEGDNGIFSAFKVHGATDSNLITYMDYQNKTVDNITVTAYSRYEEQTGFFQLVWKVHNGNYLPKSIDLGVFYDSELSYNDNNTMEIRNDGRGIRMLDYDPNEKAALSYTLFLKDYGNYPSVDSWYFKPVEKVDGAIPTENMPFFKNSDDIEKNGNAMIAFSWNNRLIGGGQTVEFVATFVGDFDAFDPTHVIDYSIKPDYLQYNDTFRITIVISDADFGQQLKLKITVNDTQYEEIITINDIGYGVWSTEIKIVEGMHYVRYTCQAIDVLDPRSVSNTLNVTVPVGGPPTFHLYERYMKSRYFVGDQIRIAGFALDEEAFTIKYSFDGAEYQPCGPARPSSFDRYDFFDYNITIPAELTPGEIHYLSVIVTDPYGFSEFMADPEGDGHPFMLLEKHPPVLLKGGFNTKVAKPGQKLIAYAMIQHQLQDIYVTAQVKFGDSKNWIEAKKSVMATNPPTPFAWYVDIPRDLEPGTYNVQIRAVDQDGLISEMVGGQTIQINQN